MAALNYEHLIENKFLFFIDCMTVSSSCNVKFDIYMKRGRLQIQERFSYNGLATTVRSCAHFTVPQSVAYGEAADNATIRLFSRCRECGSSVPP